MNASYHSDHASVPYGHSAYLNTSSNAALCGEYTPLANAQPDYFAPQLCGQAQAPVGSSGHQYAHEAVAGPLAYALDGCQVRVFSISAPTSISRNSQTHANEYTGMPKYYEQAAKESSGPYYQESYYQDPTCPVARPSNQYQVRISAT